MRKLDVVFGLGMLGMIGSGYMLQHLAAFGLQGVDCTINYFSRVVQCDNLELVSQVEFYGAAFTLSAAACVIAYANRTVRASQADDLQAKLDDRKEIAGTFE